MLQSVRGFPCRAVAVLQLDPECGNWECLCEDYPPSPVLKLCHAVEEDSSVFLHVLQGYQWSTVLLHKEVYQSPQDCQQLQEICWTGRIG